MKTILLASIIGLSLVSVAFAGGENHSESGGSGSEFTYSFPCSPVKLQEIKENCALSFGFSASGHLSAAGYREFACLAGYANPGCDEAVFQMCIDKNLEHCE